ncbi:hypothetical protein ZIOFF_014367 [Zingiber officinale]|uniref:Uncharacterized protein n=1 Tax=Zingiber officinale TaxID=94328 RepID=A0A8J5LDT5_ZINOF|nr:hypothetical protein ZIOFF_014367 [Zingiber officinale]
MRASSDRAGWMALVPSPAPMATPTTASGRPTASRVSAVSPMPTATTTRVRGAATSKGPWALPVANGNQYVGEWRDDVIHGHDTLIWPNGNSCVSLATEKNYPRICIWDSNSKAGDVTCDVVDSRESSLLCRDESSNASGSLIGTVKRLQSSSAWPTTEVKKPGQTKGHKNYDLMLNLQLGISYTIRKPSSAQLRELKQTDFDPRKKSWTSQGKEQEKQVFWALAPLTSMSWANVGDDDDDDYYATTAPPQAVWGLKKKEMAELDALLHEMGIANKDNKKQLEQSSEGEKKESVGAPSENIILKKKKSKKEKSSKEQEEHDQNQEKGDIEAEVADATAVDVKERIKKVASMRKKKSSKEMDVEHRFVTRHQFIQTSDFSCFCDISHAFDDHFMIIILKGKCLDFKSIKVSEFSLEGYNASDSDSDEEKINIKSSAEGPGS